MGGKKAEAYPEPKIICTWAYQMSTEVELQVLRHAQLL